MAVRFTKSLAFPFSKCSSGMFTDNNNVTDDGLLRVIRPNNCYMYVAPARYSNVRKVVFNVALQWLENDPGTTVDIRLMVGPMSESNTAREIHGLLIPKESRRRTVDSIGGTTPWSYEPFHLVNANYQNVMLYEKRGVQDTLTGKYNGIITEGDVHMFRVEFDRFSGQADDFFADWDAIATNEDDDEYVAYNVYLGLVVSTYSGDPLGTIHVLSGGINIVQAPGPINNTSTIVQAGRLGGFMSTDLCLTRRTAFTTHPDEHLSRWAYNAGEWDGITQVVGVTQIATGISGAGDALRTRVNRVPGPTESVTTLDQQDFTGTGGSIFMDIVRSADVFPSMISGDILSQDFLMEGSPANFTTSPQQFIEIIQKSCTKSVFYIAAGRSPGNASADHAAVLGHGFYDPLFFEEFADDQVFTRRFEGVVRHELLTNLYQAVIRHDGQLDSEDDRADGPSATALTIGGGQINSSGLDDALNPQGSFQQYPITSNDPFQLFGEKKVYSKTTGSVVGADDGGWSAVVYAHDVPTTDIVELGPLFELGDFNPDGCAATSAGLGDPGVLVITNGSTIPQKFDPQADLIEDAGVPVPFKNEQPAAFVGDTTASPTRGLGLGSYKYRYTFRNCCTGKESDPNPEDIEVDTSGASPAARVTLSFNGVRIPSDSQICEICIYRTVLGGVFPVMAKVGCFDPDVTDLFVDDIADAELDFTNDGLSILNAPMPCVPVVIEFQNRLFGLGDVPELSPSGTVSVVNGSIVVTGDEDVRWSRCLAGKYIQFEGDCRAYEIASVEPPVDGLSPPFGRLCLVEEYEGETDTGLNYTICGHPNRLHVSEPFEPECWPAASFLDIEPGDGDRLMGGISNFSRLVLCKRNKTYVLSFRSNPVTEVSSPTRISSDIGCVGPRTFAQVENGSVWLADRGLVMFNGGSVGHIPESDRMNDLFVDPDNERYMRRDKNGRVIGAVGVFYPKREQYLCCIPTKKTSRGANLMVVWDVKLKNVTLYEFCQEFLSMVVAKDSDGNERVYVGDVNGFVWILDIGGTDGVGYPNSTGTVRGTITGVGVDEQGASFIDDSNASFLTGGVPGLASLSGVAGLSGAFDGNETGLAGVCVHFRKRGADKDDPWQVRTVYAATSTRLYITPNWAGQQPDLTDEYEYMLGAIDFQAVFKPRDYGTFDVQKRTWSHVLQYIPESVSSQLRIELLTDLSTSDRLEDAVLSGEPPATGGGRIFDLSFNRGRLVAPTGIDVHSYMQVKLSNFAPEEPARIVNHILRMTGRPQ